MNTCNHARRIGYRKTAIMRSSEKKLCIQHSINDQNSFSWFKLIATNIDAMCLFVRIICGVTGLWAHGSDFPIDAFLYLYRDPTKYRGLYYSIKINEDDFHSKGELKGSDLPVTQLQPWSCYTKSSRRPGLRWIAANQLEMTNNLRQKYWHLYTLQATDISPLRKGKTIVHLQRCF